MKELGICFTDEWFNTKFISSLVKISFMSWKPFLGFIRIAGILMLLFAGIQSCSPGQQSDNPYQFLTGDWKFQLYEQDGMDLSPIMEKLFVRIGPCDAENRYCQAYLIPFSTVPQEVLDLLDNNLEISFHLRNSSDSESLIEEMEMALPDHCQRCFTIQDDIHDNHIYSVHPEGENAIRFTLLSDEEEEQFTMVRIKEGQN